MTRTRALEAYWSGFVRWMFAALDRRWFGSVVRTRLRAAALDVGEALIVARTGAPGGEAAVVGALDRFGWLVSIAGGLRELDAEEVARARNAAAVVSRMLSRAPLSGPSAAIPAASAPGARPRSSPRIRAASSPAPTTHRTLVPVTPTNG